PFFCSVGFFDTHRYHGFLGDESSPFNSSKPRFPADPEEVRIPPHLPQNSTEVKEDITDFVSAVKDFDNYVGKMRLLIEDSSIKDNTLIIFTVDHGIPLPRQKCTMYDPGIHVPLIMHMPNEIPGGRRLDDLISNIDILPTLLDFSGLKKPKEIQGNSIAGLVTDNTAYQYTPRKHINAELTFHDYGFNPIRCIRTKKWKYIKNLVPLDILFEMPNDISNSKSGKAYLNDHPEYHSQRPDEELYNLELDPMELTNLANNPEFEKIKKDLSTKLMKFLEETQDPALKGIVAEPEVPEKGPKRYIYDFEVEK
ncbi:MAG: sulfatase/phosphatase domain-containing protein, partial [Promethearchaeota archaeon]